MLYNIRKTWNGKYKMKSLNVDVKQWKSIQIFSRNLVYIQIRSIHAHTSYYDDDHVLKFVGE